MLRAGARVRERRHSSRSSSVSASPAGTPGCRHTLMVAVFLWHELLRPPSAKSLPTSFRVSRSTKLHKRQATPPSIRPATQPLARSCGSTASQSHACLLHQDTFECSVRRCLDIPRHAIPNSTVDEGVSFHHGLTSGSWRPSVLLYAYKLTA